jgi:hypothetical protein
LPSQGPSTEHIEPTTNDAYASNLNRHSYPFFARKLMYQITGALLQRLGDDAGAKRFFLALSTGK